jgi:hypothetical protein
MGLIKGVLFLSLSIFLSRLIYKYFNDRFPKNMVKYLSEYQIALYIMTLLVILF